MSSLEGDELALWREYLEWTHKIWAEVERAVFDATGLSPAEFRILHRLVDRDGRMPQLELQDALGWSPSRLSHQLRRMESRRWLRRTSLPAGRALVAITEDGGAILQRALQPHADAVHAAFLDPLSSAQQATLRGIVARVSGEPFNP